MAHQFCTLHRIAYNDDLDPTCPQCMIGRIAGHEQLDFDIVSQKPRAADGTLLNPRTLKPAV